MDLRPLRRHRDYRWLYAAQFVSVIGSMVTYVALPYQVYRLTGSSFAVGLLGVAELVPLLVTAFIGGALADALDRRRVVLATDVGLAVGCALLTANALLPRPRVWPLFLAAALMSALSGLQRPSVEAITPRLLSKDELVAAAIRPSRSPGRKSGALERVRRHHSDSLGDAELNWIGRWRRRRQGAASQEDAPAAYPDRAGPRHGHG